MPIKSINSKELKEFIFNLKTNMEGSLMKHSKFSKEIDIKQFVFLSKYAIIITTVIITFSSIKKLLLGY